MCTKLNSVTFATGSNITDASFGSEVFPEGTKGDGGNTLKTAYKTGKAGTYTRAANGSTWTKGESATSAPATATPVAGGTPGLAFTAINRNKEYSVAKGTVTTGAVVIPASYNNLPVTEINYDAFKGTQITAVTIPNSVTDIGGEAFSGCTSLTSVTIPDSVTYIGFYAFFNCRSLNSVTIPKSVTKIDSLAFQGCTSLTSVTFAGSIPMEDFEDDAFRGLGDIRNKYFAAGGGAGTYTRPDGKSATWTKGGSATVAPAATAGTAGLAFTLNADGKGYSVAKGTVTSGAVVIPATYNNLPVTAIGAQAFVGTQITTLTIPNSVTSIGGTAFNNCTSLTSVTIPSSVTSIADWAFNNCTSLTSVTIPSSVTSIGDGAFNNCQKLTSVTFQGTIPANSIKSSGTGSTFQGDLIAKYLAGGAGTYTTSDRKTWTKK